ncbi:hypothetical protein B0H13DRAFT_1715160 [Mycena leptocephala]|nr:hypothetical protein B0H13DRAFT_1715160 [Mycena leptocephala]
MLANLEADRARVGDLESQILHLERSLSALREEKILVQERLASYKYPVLELPSEIVSEIFMHFLPDYPLFPPLTGLLSPTLLTHICRRWREIALGTPALWSTIKSYHDDRDISLDMHHIKTWLNRSRCCPLSLQFGRGDPRLDITQVLKTVVPHRARWEHLDCYLPPSHIPIIDGPMPLLRFLALFLLNSPVVAIELRALHSARFLCYAPSFLMVLLLWASSYRGRN